MTREEIEALEGEQLAAAVAVEVMGWQILERGMPIEARRVFGDSLELCWADSHLAYACTVAGWRPDLHVEQAFQVMRARPEWTWDVSEMGKEENFTPVVRVMVSPGGSDFPLLGYEVEKVKDNDWTRAWCTAICRCALLAVRG